MLTELFYWLSRMEFTKPFVLVLFFITFILLLVYVYSNKKRSARLETYKHIPFIENDLENKCPKNTNTDENEN